jgi:hypothetical protein
VQKACEGAQTHLGFVALGDMAVHKKYDRAAEQALSDISTPSQPRM